MNTEDSKPAAASGATVLKQFFDQEADTLLPTLRQFVFKAGLVSDPRNIDEVAGDLLREVVAEVLTHAEKFDVARQPRAWILGFASKIVQRMRVEQAKRRSHELLAGDLYRTMEADAARDIGTVFDSLILLAHNLADTDDELLVAARDEVDRLLSLLPDSDREVLDVALAHDLFIPAIAGALNISVNAARVRLHRAIRRVRTVMGEG